MASDEIPARLHGPIFCPRVCSTCECEDGRGRHHWIETSLHDDGEDECTPEVAAAVRAHDEQHGTDHATGFYGCAHCPAWAEWDFADGME